jgi:hypothetical protein
MYSNFEPLRSEQVLQRGLDKQEKIMSIPRSILMLLLGLASIGTYAQGTVPPATPTTDAAARPKHEPPPNAYTDCKGKKAGDAVQHQTPGVVVAASCVDSPKGLVARPVNPPQKPA